MKSDYNIAVFILKARSGCQAVILLKRFRLFFQKKVCIGVEDKRQVAAHQNQTSERDVGCENIQL